MPGSPPRRMSDPVRPHHRARGRTHRCQSTAVRRATFQLLRTAWRLTLSKIARSDWFPRKPRAPRIALRPASSMRRTPCSGPSTWALAPRIPDRRIRLWGISSSTPNCTANPTPNSQLPNCQLPTANSSLRWGVRDHAVTFGSWRQESRWELGSFTRSVFQSVCRGGRQSPTGSCRWRRRSRARRCAASSHRPGGQA